MTRISEAVAKSRNSAWVGEPEYVCKDRDDACLGQHAVLRKNDGLIENDEADILQVKGTGMDLLDGATEQFLPS